MVGGGLKKGTRPRAVGGGLQFDDHVVKIEGGAVDDAASDAGEDGASRASAARPRGGWAGGRAGGLPRRRPPDLVARAARHRVGPRRLFAD